MKFVLVILSSALFLGWETGLCSACDYTKTSNCIKNKINCGDVENCISDSSHCMQTPSCLNGTYSCQSTVRVVNDCAKSYNCENPNMFKDVPFQSCQPIQPPMTAGASTLTSFAVTAGCLLTYFFMKKDE